MSPTLSSTGSASGSAADAVATFKSETKMSEQEEMNEWVSQTSLHDVLFSETKWVQLGQDAE